MSASPDDERYLIPPLYELAGYGPGHSECELIPNESVRLAYDDSIPHWDMVMALRDLGWTVEPQATTPSSEDGGK